MDFEIVYCVKEFPGFKSLYIGNLIKNKYLSVI